MTKQIINVPPFPPLQWNDYFWTGELVLRTWAGYQTRHGPYGAISSADESDGTVWLSVIPQGDSQTPPLPGQSAALRYLLDH